MRGISSPYLKSLKTASRPVRSAKPQSVMKLNLKLQPEDLIQRQGSIQQCICLLEQWVAIFQDRIEKFEAIKTQFQEKKPLTEIKQNCLESLIVNLRLDLDELTPEETSPGSDLYQMVLEQVNTKYDRMVTRSTQFIRTLTSIQRQLSQSDVQDDKRFVQIIVDQLRYRMLEADSRGSTMMQSLEKFSGSPLPLTIERAAFQAKCPGQYLNHLDSVLVNIKSEGVVRQYTKKQRVEHLLKYTETGENNQTSIKDANSRRELNDTLVRLLFRFFKGSPEAKTLFLAEKEIWDYLTQYPELVAFLIADDEWDLSADQGPNSFPEKLKAECVSMSTKDQQRRIKIIESRNVKRTTETLEKFFDEPFEPFSGATEPKAVRKKTKNRSKKRKKRNKRNKKTLLKATCPGSKPASSVHSNVQKPEAVRVEVTQLEIESPGTSISSSAIAMPANSIENHTTSPKTKPLSESNKGGTTINPDIQVAKLIGHLGSALELQVVTPINPYKRNLELFREFLWTKKTCRFTDFMSEFKRLVNINVPKRTGRTGSHFRVTIPISDTQVVKLTIVRPHPSPKMGVNHLRIMTKNIDRLIREHF